MKPSIYQIPLQHPSHLFIMPKPSGEWLREDLQHYRSAGADVIVSMLEPSEVKELSLMEEGNICQELGICFNNFPIPDRGLPLRDDFVQLVDLVVRYLQGGRNVAVHCRAGIGRSGVLVCCATALLIGSAQRAIAFVSAARGVEVPDTEEQRAFIQSVVLEMQENPRNTV